MNYCGCKTSCFTLDGWNSINNGIHHDKSPIKWCRISRPSTYVMKNFVIRRFKYTCRQDYITIVVHIIPAHRGEHPFTSQFGVHQGWFWPISRCFSVAGGIPIFLGLHRRSHRDWLDEGLKHPSRPIGDDNGDTRGLPIFPKRTFSYCLAIIMHNYHWTTI